MSVITTTVPYYKSRAGNSNSTEQKGQIKRETINTLELSFE